MRAIVSGATGFIGTALCRELLAAGHEVTALVRPRSGKCQKLPDGTACIELALDDLRQLRGCWDVFYHLAWNGASGASRDDFYAQERNLAYVAEAVRAAKRCGCTRFVGAGSQTEYGRVKGVCAEETTPHPFTLYGAAKLSAYHLGRLVAAQEHIRFIWPRIYSVYGVGENPGTLISYLFDTLHRKDVPQLTSCETMWDFLYITDCAAALRLLGENEAADGLYNVSYGKPKPLRHFVETIRDLIAPASPLAFGARESVEAQTFWLEPDIGKLRGLGFYNKISFSEGIQRLIK